MEIIATKDKKMNDVALEVLAGNKVSPVSLALDNYEDLFSDFDTRSYTERLLSDDFLHELKRASLDRQEGGLALQLVLLNNERNAGTERIIRDRMKIHFSSHRQRLEDKLKRDRKLGYLMLTMGVVLMFVATAILSLELKSLWTNFIVVLLEPAGWFTFWEGLSLIFFRSRDITADLRFYRKMTGAKIQFLVAQKS